MTKKFFLLLTLCLFSLSGYAQYTSDGVYTIKCVASSKYISADGTTAKMKSDNLTDNEKFYILESTASPNSYNIIVKSTGNVLDARTGTPAFAASSQDVLTSTLFTLVDDGTNGDNSIFEIVVANTYAINGNKSSKTLVGRGTKDNTSSGYSWIITRIADIPAPAPIVSMTSPISNINVLPGASLKLTASAQAEENATLSSVEFFVDDVFIEVGSLNGEVYECTWTAPTTTGSYAIAAKATSSNSAVTESSAINVIVASNPAAIAMVWPAKATTILPNKEVKFTANATASTGYSVTSVEFFDGNVKLGDGALKSGVYEFTTHIDEIKTLSITAKLTDTNGEVVSTNAIDLNTSLTTPVRSLYMNFEGTDNSANWTWVNGYSSPVSYVTYPTADKARSTANKVACVDFASETAIGGRNLACTGGTGFDALSDEGSVYIYVHSAGDHADLCAGPTLYSTELQPSPTPSKVNDDQTFNMKQWNKGTSSMGGDIPIYPAVRMDRKNTNGKIYFDDIVMYYDPEANGYDNTAATSAVNIQFSPSEGSNTIAWDEGYDIGIGIDSTYILRTSTSVDAPVLIDQLGYSDKGLPTGLNTVGEWTVVGVVPLGTTSYTDNSSVSGTTYTYAIVHKDYAYNYSAATIANNVVTTINNTPLPKFNCVGKVAAIELSALTIGQKLEVYTLNGVKIYETTINNSSMSIKVPQGFYILRTDRLTSKVVVR